LEYQDPGFKVREQENIAVITDLSFLLNTSSSVGSSILLGTTVSSQLRLGNNICLFVFQFLVLKKSLPSNLFDNILVWFWRGTMKRKSNERI